MITVNKYREIRIRDYFMVRLGNGILFIKEVARLPFFPYYYYINNMYIYYNLITINRNQSYSLFK